MPKPDYITAKGRINGFVESMYCDQCGDLLENGDMTRDIFSGSLDDSDMIARCCSTHCAMNYLEALP